MYPYLVRVGGFSLPAYPVLYGLAITLGGIVLLWLGGRKGLDRRKLAHVVLVVAISCILGGRLFYVLHFVNEFRGNWYSAFDLSEGGQVFYGGLFLAIPCLFLFSKVVKLPWKTVFDLTAVAAPAGLALGRWACFCRGCCYGKLSDVPWAVRFPKYVDIHGQTVGSLAFLRHVEKGLVKETATHSLPVHPAQIYSSLLSLAVFLLMLWLWKKQYARGRLILVYLLLYAVTRFFVEFFRDNQMAFAGLTVAQVLSIAIAIVGVTLLVMDNLRGRSLPGQRPSSRK